jgi:hypothetical protein
LNFDIWILWLNFGDIHETERYLNQQSQKAEGQSLLPHFGAHHWHYDGDLSDFHFAVNERGYREQIR